ncbi:hypothetical protein VSVS12_04188 [Vibrio scophthalmi]|uniref:hypothetical protein n=1 Tax=Vibrio scophthalmi TaxID=45658 RepID=UPI000809486E|nr:hypothetical protein [Vibrio scophthalmi]ANS87888.1 hypothetical protein VSVS12_04188 [Vibrio scophthalmi]
MQLPTSLYLSNSLDQCVSVGKSLHTIRHILEPHFYTREIHRSLLANWSLRRDIDFHLTVFDDYQRNLKYYYSIDDELVDGIAEITLFNLISSTSEFCMHKTINNWYRLFLAKRYVDDLPKLKKLPNLTDKAHKTIVQHSMLAKCALGAEGSPHNFPKAQPCLNRF